MWKCVCLYACACVCLYACARVCVCKEKGLSKLRKKSLPCKMSTQLRPTTLLTCLSSTLNNYLILSLILLTMRVAV